MTKNWLSLFLLGLASCASFQPDLVEKDALCSLSPFRLDVATERVTEALDVPLSNSEPMLFLSGGSQKGAFGGGYLKGWDDSGQFPPNFAVVTGVSTGGLQSINAFTGDVQNLAKEYFIDAESDLLKSYVGDGDLGLMDYITIVNKGSVGELTPLKELIETKLTEKDAEGLDLIEKINRKYVKQELQNAYKSDVGHDINPDNPPQRMLLIVATSVDDGNAYAFDMSRLANRIVRHRDKFNTAKVNHLIGCFSDVMLASSAVPLAAQPVFIDNTMYIDGGAKFAVANHRVSSDPKVFTGVDKKKDVFIIINGQTGISKNCKICGTLKDSPQHKPWSFMDLAGRSIDLLTNQIKQYSVAKIEAEADAENNRVMRARLCSDYLDYPGNSHRDEFYIENCKNLKVDPEAILFSDAQKTEIIPKDLDDASMGLNGTPCNEYLRQDKENLKPVEFHRNFMACLVEYGCRRAEAVWGKRPSRQAGNSPLCSKD